MGLQAGAALGRYRLQRRLGAGGFAEVWEAERLDNGQRIALKVLEPGPDETPELVQRFIDEGRLASRIAHPRSVFVLSAEQIGGVLAIGMELMPGGTLQDVLDRSGAFPAPKAVDAALDVLAGLEAAHRLGIVHRDVKPSNCFIDTQGRVKVGDYGISKSLERDARLTATGTFLGTPAYAAPEQVRGRAVDERTDLYSVGATLHALLSGGVPFEASHAGDMLARIASEPPRALPSTVPAGLRRIVLRLMAKDPEDRLQTCAEAVKALKPYGTQRHRPAPVLSRLRAYITDAIAMSVLALLANGLGDRVPAPSLPAGSMRTAAMLLVVAAYWPACELLLGATLGRMSHGLRVVRADGMPAERMRRVARGALFGTTGWTVSVAVLLVGFDTAWLARLSDTILATWALVRIAPLAFTRGERGLHDLITGTRVVVSGSADATHVETGSEGPARALRPVAEAQNFGSWQVLGACRETPGASLLVAHDGSLERRAWLLVTHRGTRPRTPPARATRLHWLDGSERGDTRWDAWEMPDGTSLVAHSRARGGIPWSQAQPLLLALASELEAGLREGDLPGNLSPWNLWRDSSGGLRVLEFPAPDAPEEEPAGWDPGELLHGAAILLLDGTLPEKTTLHGRLPRAALPMPVRAALERLFVRRALPVTPTAVIEGVAELTPGRGLRVEVTRAQRMRSWAASLAPLLACGAGPNFRYPAIFGVIFAAMDLAMAPGRVTLEQCVLELTGIGWCAALWGLVLGTFAFLSGRDAAAWIARLDVVSERTGARATRGHLAVHALAAWAPLLVATLATLLVTDGVWPGEGRPAFDALPTWRAGALQAAAALVGRDYAATAIGAIVPFAMLVQALILLAALRTPARGPIERLTGTVLVPR